MRNWTKMMIVLVVLLVLFWIPVTRAAILIILPLGSGVDDLVFFILLFLIVGLLLIRAAGNPIKKFVTWIKH